MRGSVEHISNDNAGSEYFGCDLENKFTFTDISRENKELVNHI